MNSLSKSQWNSFLGDIDKALDAGATPIAAFDADGTLWSCDMGEGLFKYQIKHGLLPQLPKDAWDFYAKWHHDEPLAAFLWLAQINAGVSLDVVRQWAKEAVEEMESVPLFEEVQALLIELRKRKVKSYVVTASVKWAVEPAAGLLGFHRDEVIGIATKVNNGLVTDEQDGPITWREGKVDGLLRSTQGKKPFFAAGNTKGDLPLLESASHLRLVMASAGPGHINYQTEQEMLALAKERGWYAHRYL